MADPNQEEVRSIFRRHFGVACENPGFFFQIRRKSLARLAGSESGTSPASPPIPEASKDDSMEEDELQKQTVTRSQSSVIFPNIFNNKNAVDFLSLFRMRDVTHYFV